GERERRLSARDAAVPTDRTGVAQRDDPFDGRIGRDRRVCGLRLERGAVRVERRYLELRRRELRWNRRVLSGELKRGDVRHLELRDLDRLDDRPCPVDLLDHRLLQRWSRGNKSDEGDGDRAERPAAGTKATGHRAQSRPDRSTSGRARSRTARSRSANGLMSRTSCSASGAAVAELCAAGAVSVSTRDGTSDGVLTMAVNARRARLLRQ